MNKILFATAGGAVDETAEYIAGIAESLDAYLVVLHVTDYSCDDEVDDVFDRFAIHACRYDVEIKTLKTTGDVVEGIMRTAKEQDVSLIVMGASRGKVLSRWTSSVVFGSSSIPVLVIPHDWTEDDNE